MNIRIKENIEMLYYFIFSSCVFFIFMLYPRYLKIPLLLGLFVLVVRIVLTELRIGRLE